VASCPAGGVERNAHRQPVEDLPHDGLLDLEQRVARLVVRRGPLRVALLHRHRRLLDAVAELVGSIEQRTNLPDPRECELAVVLAGERAQQSDPLEAEEIRQRVLIDHATADAGHCRCLLIEMTTANAGPTVAAS
jgi:hypothetical protein